MQCAFGRPDDDLVGRAESLDGPFVRALVEAAGPGDTTVVAGMFESLPGEDRVYNTLVVVDGSGLRGRYRKLHLYDALDWRESDRVRPGDPGEDGLLVLPVEDQFLGVMTCYDLRFPEMGRALASCGATVLVVPAAWVNGPGKTEQWRVLLQARAIEETCYVVGAAQPSPELTGHSMAVEPRGHVTVALDEGSEAMAVADLSAERVASVRAALPLLDGRRFDVVPRR
jgi:deaminated glutathione amidase